MNYNINVFVCVLLVHVAFVAGTAGVPVHGANGSTDDDVIANIGNNRRLRGVMKTLPSNNVAYTFLGIRYALAPTGQRRFAEPQTYTHWPGTTTDALTAGPQCPQSEVPVPDKPESEDCLFLNVYTPAVNSSVPVMVWIHGGSFYVGAGNEHDGSSLAARGVVVVTINYRLGHLGFLSTGDDVMPGNYGMLDQVLALKWVRDNIGAFGGDPNSVTVFGQSSGSVAVSLLVLSPLAQGLFLRAIMQSGVSMNPWAIERPGTKFKVQEYTKEIATLVGCNQTDSSLLLQCLRTSATSQELLVASRAAKKTLKGVMATPRVETKFGFLPEYPENLLKKGSFNRVDTIRGYNFGEWAYKINDPEDNGITRDEFKAHLLLFNDLYGLQNYDEIVHIIENEYISNQTDPFQIRAALVNAFTDFLYSAGEAMELDEVSTWSASDKKHYLYEFNFPRRVENQPTWMGALHGAELPFVFAEEPYMVLPIDYQVSDTVQLLWTDFAKSGNPVLSNRDQFGTGVVWNKFTSSSQAMLKITNTTTMTTYPRPAAVTMYRNIMKKYLRGQQITPSIIIG